MMQRVLVTTGIFILLSVSLLWGYLLVFGVPKDSSDVFADFGFPVEEAERPTELTPSVTDNTVVDVSSNQLAQLTTKPVAGWQSVAVSSTSEKLIYAEQGTGHVFSIDMTTGQEERIDNTTVPGVYEAYFSQNGEVGVFVTNSDGANRVMVRSVAIDSSNENYLSFELPPESENIYFNSSNILNYTHITSEGTDGYEYDLLDQTQSKVFSIPFHEVVVDWSNVSIYLYNKPAPYFKGTFYEVTENKLASVLSSEYNLMAVKYPDKDATIYTAADINTDQLVSYVYESENIIELPILMIPEKCAFIYIDVVAELWCAAPYKNAYERSFAANWYKGTEQSSDSLWRFDLESGAAIPVVDFTETSGRNVDVDTISTGTGNSALFFRNKIDNTLWRFQINI